MTRERGRELAGVPFKGVPPSRAVQPDLILQMIDQLFVEVWEMMDEQEKTA